MSNKVSFLDLRKINARFSAVFHEDLTKVLESGWYLRGEATAQFEQAFASIAELSIVWALPMD